MTEPKPLYLNTLLSDGVFCVIGILKNDEGVPEDEENFDEAIKNVNSALVPTKVKRYQEYFYSCLLAFLYFNWKVKP